MHFSKSFLESKWAIAVRHASVETTLLLFFLYRTSLFLIYCLLDARFSNCELLERDVSLLESREKFCVCLSSCCDEFLLGDSITSWKPDFQYMESFQTHCSICRFSKLGMYGVCNFIFFIWKNIEICFTFSISSWTCFATYCLSFLWSIYINCP